MSTVCFIGSPLRRCVRWGSRRRVGAGRRSSSSRSPPWRGERAAVLPYDLLGDEEPQPEPRRAGALGLRRGPPKRVEEAIADLARDLAAVHHRHLHLLHRSRARGETRTGSAAGAVGDGVADEVRYDLREPVVVPASRADPPRSRCRSRARGGPGATRRPPRVRAPRGPCPSARVGCRPPAGSA